MTFYDWIIEKYKLKNGEWKNNQYGDLACDIYQDRCFPRASKSKDEIRGHLKYVHCADSQVLECFDYVYGRYSKEAKDNVGKGHRSLSKG